jgi:hypothetical protein
MVEVMGEVSTDARSYKRGDGKRRFFAVLHHLPPVTGPREAAIVAEARAK